MLSKFVAYLNRITELVAGFMMIVMVAVIFVQVFARFVLSTGFGWAEELARFLFIWCVFLGASIGVYYNAHLGIEALVKHFAPAGRKAAALIGHLLCVILFCHLIGYGWKILPIVGRQISPGLGVSMAWPYAAILVGGALMLLHTVVVIVRLVARKEGGRA